MENIDLPKVVRERLIVLGARTGDRCLLALSGGQDSTALLLALLAGWNCGNTVVAAHLDHAVREGSEEDLFRVKQLCGQLGVRFVGQRLDPEDVHTLGRKTGSLEGALRKFRYDFLLSSAASFGAKWVLTGHTSDDQAETVLFRVLRGMEPMSFSGMPERRSRILRPLLGYPRSQTLSYCREKGVEPLMDLSNFDCRHTRNRLRYETIPFLERKFHPGLRDLLLRVGSLSGRLDGLMETVLAPRFQGVFDPPGTHLLKGGLDALPPLLREHVVARFLKGGVGQWPSGSLLKEAFGRIRNGKRGSMSLPGGMIMVGDEKGFSIRNGAPGKTSDVPMDPVPFPIPGVLRFDAAGITLFSEEITLKSPFSFPGGDTTLIRKSQLRSPLWVRRRVPGDRFIPLGMDGEKKLKDFLIDRKVPLPVRDFIPLVLDNDGQILWVGGVGISRNAALEGFEGEEAVLLRMERSVVSDW